MISNQRKNSIYGKISIYQAFSATNSASLEIQLNSSQLRLNKYISDLISCFEISINKKI